MKGVKGAINPITPVLAAATTCVVINDMDNGSSDEEQAGETALAAEHGQPRRASHVHNQQSTKHNLNSNDDNGGAKGRGTTEKFAREALQKIVKILRMLLKHNRCVEVLRPYLGEGGK